MALTFFFAFVLLIIFILLTIVYIFFFNPIRARRPTANQLQKSFRGSQSSLQSRQSSEIPPHMKDRPTSAYVSNKDSYNLQNQVRIAAVWLCSVYSVAYRACVFIA